MVKGYTYLNIDNFVDRSHDVDKKSRINFSLAGMATTNKTPVYAQKALILDGPRAATSNALMFVGFKARNIHVPNHDKETVKHITRNAPGVFVRERSVMEHIAPNKGFCIGDISFVQYNFVYLDFTAVYRTVAPTIMALFDCNVLADDAILAFALCTRCRLKTTMEQVEAQMQNDLDDVCKRNAISVAKVHVFRVALYRVYVFRVERRVKCLGKRKRTMRNKPYMIQN